MSDEDKSPDLSGVSRRGFLKGISISTVTTGLLTPGIEQEAAAADGDLVGPEEFPITLRVNGERHRLSAEPRVTLLDALRNRMNLTGCKKVCDRGTCGACTVLVDDQPVYSCCMLAVEAVDRKITTVEGLGTPGEMNPVQEAFVERDAQQCGFCTPGFVVACTAFVRENPAATLEQIRDGVGGNLCRCGTYAGMLMAVADAAKKGGV